MKTRKKLNMQPLADDSATQQRDVSQYEKRVKFNFCFDISSFFHIKLIFAIIELDIKNHQKST